MDHVLEVDAGPLAPSLHEPLVPHLGLAHGDELAGLLCPGGAAIAEDAVVTTGSMVATNKVEIHLNVAGVGGLECAKLHVVQEQFYVGVVLLREGEHTDQQSLLDTRQL